MRRPTVGQVQRSAIDANAEFSQLVKGITHHRQRVYENLVGVMTFESPGDGALDYYPCRYGNSRLIFRGPRRDLALPYVSVLGGTETYGRYIPEPYPALIEAGCGLRTVNLGLQNAGLDVYLKDADVLAIVAKSRVAVIQIMGAQNLSNRFYVVHPRRNDRFLHPTPLLQSMFSGLDFTEFHFTRHMLGALQRASVDRFEVVAEELRSAWVLRMRSLLARLTCPTILVWIGSAPPPAPERRARLTVDPLLIDSEMIAAVVGGAEGYLEFVPSAAALQCGGEGMVFGPMDRPTADRMPGPAVHRELAIELGPLIKRLAGH